MTLVAIILATLAAGIGSVWLAALLMRLGLGGRADSVGPQHLLSLAAGALLATAFMHLLPEAFESQAGAHDLFATLLVGVVFFFCSTRPSCGTTGMNTATRSPHRKATGIPTMPNTAMTMAMAMRTITTARARAAGPCSRATACIVLATAS